MRGQTVESRPPNSGAAARIVTALAVGVLQSGVAISLAALVFAGALSPGAGRAAAGFVLGSAIVSLIVGVGTKMPVAIAGAQDTSAIVLAAVAASMAASGSLSDDELLPTVLATGALAALLAGVAFWVLGQKALTGFVRYLPWPVVTGFTAGTGWLLLRGGIEVMRSDAIDFLALGDLFTADTAAKVAPGLALALLMVVVLRSKLSNTLISVAILVAVALFHLVGLSATSLDELEADGWLIGPFPESEGWQPLGPSDLSRVDWGVMLSHTVPIIALVAVAVVGMLLNLSGLEPILDTEIDMDHEMQLSGVANVGVAVSGGVIGWHLIGDTALASKLGARGRLVPVVAGVMGVGIFLLGTDIIGLLPRVVAGGVLSGLGLTLLVDWALATMPRLNTVDRTISVVILAGIAILGVLPGVGLGVLIATAVFILRYSRIDPARHVIDAAGRSTVDRRPDQRQLLAASRGEILAIELQGYLFFGSTVRLRAMLESLDSDARYLVIDMARVSGVDSTAASGLATMAAKFRADGLATVWSSISDELTDELRRNDLDLSDAHQDLDHAIAWCEDRLLEAKGSVVEGAAAEIESLVPADLRARMEKRSLAPGEVLIRTGDTDRDLYFVDSGSLTAWVTSDAGVRTRLRRVLAGTVVGEVAFCRGGVRTADVTADSDVEVRVLTRERFDELAADEPDLAIELQELLLRLLSSRLAATSAMVRDLKG